MTDKKNNSITPEKVRDKAKKELNRLEKIHSNKTTMEIINDFKNKFNICESVYKVVLKEDQKNRNKKPTTRLYITMTQVPSALKFAGYSFDKDFLNELFGSQSSKGKTVKKLRDAVTHNIDDNALQEILRRKDELFGYMDYFLSTIKNFDEKTVK